MLGFLRVVRPCACTETPHRHVGVAVAALFGLAGDEQLEIRAGALLLLILSSD
jgi:hypothetical protein